MTAISYAVRGLGQALKGLDRVWAALILLFAGLAVFLPEQAAESVVFTLRAFGWILPFLLISVLLAAWLKAAGADRLIGAAVSRSPVRAIALAAAFGALSPFCSCGVVPLMAALLAAGVPLSAVMAFAMASPIMDPEMFVLMSVVVGVPFTLAKTVAALFMGLLAGFATLGLERAGLLEGALRPGIGGGCGSSCSKPSLEPPKLRWAFWHEGERRAAFASEAKSVSLFLAKWLLLAFALESLMVAWLPPETVTAYLGGAGWGAIPLSVVVGVPAYLNGFAAIPLIGELLEMGMAPGAALAFLTAGGVTSLPAAMAVYALVKRPVFAWYLALALLGSLAVGYGYQGLLVLAG
jgi:uncharacterized membrane protein YraQ (UPF0718 family)